MSVLGGPVNSEPWHSWSLRVEGIKGDPICRGKQVSAPSASQPLCLRENSVYRALVYMPVKRMLCLGGFKKYLFVEAL